MSEGIDLFYDPCPDCDGVEFDNPLAQGKRTMLAVPRGWGAFRGWRRHLEGRRPSVIAAAEAESVLPSMVTGCWSNSRETRPPNSPTSQRGTDGGSAKLLLYR